MRLFIKYSNPTFIKCIVCPKSDVVKIDRKFMFMTTVSAFAVYFTIISKFQWTLASFNLIKLQMIKL